MQTFLNRRIAHHFRSVRNRKVLLSATTGAAARNLSRSASTVHENFSIPVSGFIKHLTASNPMRTVLRESSVYVIDEMSMLTSDTFRNVLNRLIQIHDCQSLEELLQKVRKNGHLNKKSPDQLHLRSQVLIILVGDHAQLPPVCNHNRRRKKRSWDKESEDDSEEEDLTDSLCEECHLAFSPYWQMMTKFNLTYQPRFSDPGYAEFLNIIRSRQPTETELQLYLSKRSGVRYVSKAEALSLVSNGVHALCSHRRDVSSYNSHALQTIFGDRTVPVITMSNASEVTELKPWLEEPKFSSLDSIAIGARVALESNIAISKGETAPGLLDQTTSLTVHPPTRPIQAPPTARPERCKRWNSNQATGTQSSCTAWKRSQSTQPTSQQSTYCSTGTATPSGSPAPSASAATAAQGTGAPS